MSKDKQKPTIPMELLNGGGPKLGPESHKKMQEARAKEMKERMDLIQRIRDIHKQLRKTFLMAKPVMETQIALMRIDEGVLYAINIVHNLGLATEDDKNKLGNPDIN